MEDCPSLYTSKLPPSFLAILIPFNIVLDPWTELEQLQQDRYFHTQLQKFFG